MDCSTVRYSLYGPRRAATAPLWCPAQHLTFLVASCILPTTIATQGQLSLSQGFEQETMMTPWVPVDKFFLFGDSITQYSADQFGRGPSTDFVFKAKLDQGQSV